MTTTWYFQETFATAQLLSIGASACNFPYSVYGPNTQSTCITLLSLNTGFYQLHDWSNASNAYLPYSTIPQYIFSGPKGSVTMPGSGTGKLDYQKSISTRHWLLSNQSSTSYRSNRQHRQKNT